MVSKSLKASNNPLSSTKRQLEILSNGIFSEGGLPKFDSNLVAYELNAPRPLKLEILQVNIGYMCNQVCAHCHVDAGPDRIEMMSRETMELCLDVLKKTKVKTIDLTGGAPEMHPDFRWFVTQIRLTDVEEIIVRSNLTIIMANKKYHDLPHFFKQNKVHIISSLPFYKKNKTDSQRGDGVFNQSITALKLLNSVGYGKSNSNLHLDLVYNPSGAFLPANEKILEKEFKKALKIDFNIDFNQLFAITNLPISRFLDYLIASENYEDYMSSLVEAFNPKAVANLMCTNTLSVSWDGLLFDCDFNQMLGLKVASPISHLRNFNLGLLQERKICISQHCYGCTAGSGSSCQGTVV